MSTPDTSTRRGSNNGAVPPPPAVAGSKRKLEMPPVSELTTVVDATKRPKREDSGGKGGNAVLVSTTAAQAVGDAAGIGTVKENPAPLTAGIKSETMIATAVATATPAPSFASFSGDAASPPVPTGIENGTGATGAAAASLVQGIPSDPAPTGIEDATTDTSAAVAPAAALEYPKMTSTTGDGAIATDPVTAATEPIVTDATGTKAEDSAAATIAGAVPGAASSASDARGSAMLPQAVLGAATPTTDGVASPETDASVDQTTTTEKAAEETTVTTSASDGGAGRLGIVDPSSFNHYLFQLLDFRARNGNFHVNREMDIELHAWLQYLKREYKNHLTDPETSALTASQFKVLEYLHVPLTSRGDDHWNRFFELLQQYGERHGHVLVPRLCEVPGLGDWVTDQRRQYKSWKQGQPSQLTDERREKLEGLGFAWQVRNRPEWEHRYQELIAYKAKFGDCKVPQHYKENRALGKWVAKQREQYKLLKKGQHSFLTPYRLERLNQAGFVWQVRTALDTEVMPPSTSASSGSVPNGEGSTATAAAAAVAAAAPQTRTYTVAPVSAAAATATRRPVLRVTDRRTAGAAVTMKIGGAPPAPALLKASATDSQQRLAESAASAVPKGATPPLPPATTEVMTATAAPPTQMPLAAEPSAAAETALI